MCKADDTLLTLINQTHTQWGEWAQTNFPTLTTRIRSRENNTDSQILINTLGYVDLRGQYG